MRKVLNVGGGSRDIPLPVQYQGWQQVLLDIDPRGRPDIVCDARELLTLPKGEYDSIYCSHNLEHYHRHDALKVLAGFAHLLKPDGFACIRVPDLGLLMRRVVERNLDIDDVIYHSPAGPILVRDVIYGYSVEIERSGNDYYAHKTGFTRKALAAVLRKAGFPWVRTENADLEIWAVAFLAPPTSYAEQLFNLTGRAPDA